MTPLEILLLMLVLSLSVACILERKWGRKLERESLLQWHAESPQTFELMLLKDKMKRLTK